MEVAIPASKADADESFPGPGGSYIHFQKWSSPTPPENSGGRSHSPDRILPAENHKLLNIGIRTHELMPVLYIDNHAYICTRRKFQ
jgi:hypothetical protein